MVPSSERIPISSGPTHNAYVTLGGQCRDRSQGLRNRRLLPTSGAPSRTLIFSLYVSEALKTITGPPQCSIQWRFFGKPSQAFDPYVDSGTIKQRSRTWSTGPKDIQGCRLSGRSSLHTPSKHTEFRFSHSHVPHER